MIYEFPNFPFLCYGMQRLMEIKNGDLQGLIFWCQTNMMLNLCFSCQIGSVEWNTPLFMGSGFRPGRNE